jgi:hypothetical protein
MLVNIDFAGQYDAEAFGYATGLRQGFALTVRPQRSKVSDPFNLGRIQDRKHLVPSRFNDRMRGHSHNR